MIREPREQLEYSERTLRNPPDSCDMGEITKEKGRRERRQRERAIGKNARVKRDGETEGHGNLYAEDRVFRLWGNAW